jgi:hypothetical protein
MTMHRATPRRPVTGSAPAAHSTPNLLRDASLLADVDMRGVAVDTRRSDRTVGVRWRHEGYGQRHRNASRAWPSFESSCSAPSESVSVGGPRAMMSGTATSPQP